MWSGHGGRPQVERLKMATTIENIQNVKWATMYFLYVKVAVSYSRLGCVEGRAM